MNSKKKVIVSSLIAILIIMITYFGYKVIGQSTNEMISKDNSLPADFPYIEYETLINDPHILCCGKGIALIGASRTVVTSGDKSQAEPHLTMNDIGKKIFKETKSASGDVTSDNFSNPYTATTNYTYGHYTESERKIASPMESYILAEVSENVPSQGSDIYNITNKEYKGSIDDAYFYNINGTLIYGVNIDEESGEPQDFVAIDKDTGKYYYIEVSNSGEFFPYTYVQYAWWKTPAGGSSSKVKSTPFYREAEAFQKYIEKVAKRNDKGEMVTEKKTINVNGETATVTVPVIDYKVSGEYSDAKVYYDRDEEKYLIGPLKINYYEESVTTERGKVDFACITNTSIETNLGKVDDAKWSFKFKDRLEDDKAVFPHNGEEFYIILDYMDDVRYIRDIKFDFKYMNAGGEYSSLKGDYFKASWEPESKAIWCDEDVKNCACGGQHESAQYDENGNVTCAGGAKKCSHGYYHNHIIKWEYWLELKELKPSTSQPLAEAYLGARWYENASYSFPAEFKIELTIPMAGEVWIDTDPDKKESDKVYGTRQSGEKGYKNAEVYIYRTYRDSAGKIVKRELADVYDEDNVTKLNYPIYTDENGYYKIPNINVPGSSKKENDDYDVSYDVEFKYDGQHYEASPVLLTANGNANTYINASKAEKKAYEKDSLASENANVRDNYNKKFTQVYGGKAIDEKGSTQGYSTNGTNTLNLNYTSTEYTLPNSNNKRRFTELVVLDGNEHIIEQYKMTATTGNTGIYFPVNHKISLKNADDVKEINVRKNDNETIVIYKTIYDYMQHINLGVKEREKSDLSTFKDLYKANIVVNEREITKTYNKYKDVEDEVNKDALNIQIEACKIGSYTIGLYSSDYEYRSTVYNTSADVVKSIKQDTELKVYLTYRIAINNESQAANGLDATINNIDDYYDTSFTYIGNDVKANIIDDNHNRVSKVVAESPYYRIVPKDQKVEYTYWSDGMERFNCNDTKANVNSDYKKLTISAFKDTKLHAGEQLEMFITFEVDQNGYKNTTDRPNLLGEKNNIAEISNYSTYYTNGKVAGIIDQSSAPGNIDLNRNVKEWYEDDTETAPAANIILYQYNREINGNVWEDSETVKLLYNQKVGNGLLDEGEKGVNHIDVQLVEKIQIDGIEYEKIWTEDDFTDLTDEEKKMYKLKDVETDENGYYNLKGVLAGNYVVRFKYGNKESNISYNGQDYKNTAYQADMTNEDGTTTLNNEWQDLKSSKLNDTRVSDARDYELQRMKVIAYSKNINNSIGTVLESADQNVNHAELINNTQMVANTAKLNIEIEHQDFIDYGTVNKVNGIEQYTYIVKNIDFGLEERSKTVLELDKKISKIALYKNDGEEEVLSVTYNPDGTINKTAEGTKNLNKLVHVDETGNIQGLEYVNVESEYLNGMRLVVYYQIYVRNNSEVDWTGNINSFKTKQEIIDEVEKLEKSDEYVSGEFIEYGKFVGLNYYNNKNNDTDRIVETKIEKIIDYIDNDVSADEEENQLIEDSSWHEVTLEELQNGKMLDSKVYTDVDGKSVLVDSKQREYKQVLVSDDGDYNPSAITELVPEAAEEGLNRRSRGAIRVVVSKQLSEDTELENIYNNIAEILEYSNTVGRRDNMAVPGNTEVARGEYAATVGYQGGTLLTDYAGAKEMNINGEILHLNGERDADSPSFVTISEPTGISIREYSNRYIYPAVILVTGIVAVIAILIIKKKKIK